MTVNFIVFCFIVAWCIVPLSAIGDVSNSSQQQWGIGLQGNFPLWGGLSAKYTGFGRLHLQVIEHYVQNGDEYSAMLGLQTPIVVARSPPATSIQPSADPGADNTFAVSGVSLGSCSTTCSNVSLLYSTDAEGDVACVEGGMWPVLSSR